MKLLMAGTALIRGLGLHQPISSGMGGSSFLISWYLPTIFELRFLLVSNYLSNFKVVFLVWKVHTNKTTFWSVQLGKAVKFRLRFLQIKFFFRDQHFFSGPTFFFLPTFFGPKFFWTNIFFRTNIFSQPKSFGSEKI